MNYLTRLAIQTGLRDTAPLPEPPHRLDIVEEAIAAPPVPPAAPVPRIADPESTATATPPGPEIASAPVERIVVEPPSRPTLPDALRDRTDGPEQSAQRPAVSPVDASRTPRPAAPARPSTPPAELREKRIRQVLDWVAANDRPPAPVAAPAEPVATPPRSEPTAAAAARRPEPASPPVTEPPALEIAVQMPAPDAPWIAEAEPPSTSEAPRSRRRTADTPEPRIVEERIDISIGTIRLDVRPPPKASAPSRTIAAAAPLAPTPRPAPPPLSSRLRRRFIGI